ncbi:MAG TPA: hypothetical protein VL614_14925 [Acetobacteraceae bacterium]|jgi:hypothetical protein|nr:hypothetical protein [Acetobacteraceae bacterium]
MATVHQILGAMQQQISLVTAGLGLQVAVGMDFPPPKVLSTMVQQGKAVVSVMDRKLSRNTTRWAPTPIGGTVTPATLVSTVSGAIIPAGGAATITLSGPVTPGDAVSCVLANGAAAAASTGVQTTLWAVTASGTATSTPATIAAALAAAVNADSIMSTWVTATCTGAVVTLTSLVQGVLGLQSLTGNGGTTITEIGRRSRELQIITWANSIENRDLVGDAISGVVEQMEVYYGTYTNGLPLPDGTGGRVIVGNDYLLDEGTPSDTYRRDILLSIDYPVTTTDALYAVLMPPLVQFQSGFFAPQSIP